ncbi:hypothetical protein AAHE18_13G013100 [Arachis hypogaea]
MPQDSSDQDLDDADSEFVEVDPTGRYGRYKEVLGKGAFKKVYRAFDELEGIEVAWNQIKVADLLRNSEDLERLYSEVHLLKTLKHKNIIKFYNSWVDTKNENINFITEIFTSGTLRQYRKKHKHVDLRALKKWSRQILEGLLYLHSHNPPVIHRDLKCDNIFVNGNQGEVKIGDLGLAAILQQAQAAHSVIGTPEFMAPELYEEEYNELVDIYAFGMCLLELVTFEYPYIECSNAAQIYKKVTSVRNKASIIGKSGRSRSKAFIEKCIANSDSDSESVGRSSRSGTHHSGNSSNNQAIEKVFRDVSSDSNREFTVEGQRKDIDTIFLKLRIADSSGHVRNIHFPFDIGADTAISVASEMVEELELTDQDVTTIAETIDSEIRSLIPGWNPSETPATNVPEDSAVSDGCTSAETRSVSSPTENDSTTPSSNLALEILRSGRKYWSDSPKGVCGNPLSRHGSSNLSHIGDANAEKGSLTANGAISDELEPDQVTCVGAYCAEKECDSTGDSPSTERTITSGYLEETSDASSLEKIPESLEVSEIDASKIALQLESLLTNQKEELEELKRKQKLAVSNLLKELSPEICKKVLNICNLQMLDYENL